MSRTTKLITYNIKERGRKYTGTDRSNVNVQSMVDAINSPATQELVKTGDLYGYYGHEIRQLYGMNPPDTFITDDGREIRISPAVRTIELRADQEGNVSHRQEFFTNEAGEYAYHQYKAKIGGFSTAVSFIPTMITAVAPIQSPPEYEQVVGRSEWLNVVLPHDPKKRVVSLRTMPSAFRCQIAFFCPDSHGAMMVANQFCLYFKNEAKRTFSVGFELGFADDHQQQKLVDDWQFRVLENSLFPDKVASDYKNLTIVTVDCTIIGDIPIVSGLGGEWDGVTDTKEVGTPPLHKPIVGTRTPAYIAKQNSVVTEADVYDDVAENHVRLTADPKTLQVRQTKLNKP